MNRLGCWCLLSIVGVVRAESVVSLAECEPVALETRAPAAIVAESADGLFPLAYNNASDWRRGGADGAGAASIRLIEMATGEAVDDPSRWTETTSVSNLVCEGSEGTVILTCARKACFRADLLVGAATNGTAFLRFDTEQPDPGPGPGPEPQPVPDVEIVRSEAEHENVEIDTRTLDDGLRRVNGMAELLALAGTNESKWRRGGLSEGEKATLDACPLMPVKSGDRTVWCPLGKKQKVCEFSGEGKYADWQPTGRYYRLTLSVGGSVLETVVVDFAGSSEHEYATLTLKNGAAPALGKKMQVLLTDAAGKMEIALACDWTRYPHGGSRQTGTVVASGVTQYKPVAADLENWLEVTAEQDGNVIFSQAFWCSRLPVAYVTTSDGQWPTEAKEEHSGIMRLQGNDTWSKDSYLYDGKLEKIHVRGNSTKAYPKKPYKLKLDKKTNLLNMGKSKHWVLLANYQDPGLMRNKTAYDLSAELGLTAMSSEWVDVIFNGQFVGNYQLCEHVRVDSGRVEIHNWEDTAEETASALAKQLAPKGAERDALEAGLIDSMTANLAWLTSGVHVFTNGVAYTLSDYGIDVSKFDLSGGYLFELDRFDDEASNFRVTQGVIQDTLIKVSAPETLGTNQELMDAQKAMFTDFFASLQSENGYANGKSWVERADARSLVAYWLTQVIYSQLDTSWSRYAFKPQGKPLTFGPVWDVDHAVGGRAYQWTVNADGSGTITATPFRDSKGWLNGTGTIAGYREDNFYPLCVDDPYFCLLLHELWHAHRDYLLGLVSEDGVLDRDYEYLYESGVANSEKWPVQTLGNAQFRFAGEMGNAKIMHRRLKEQIEWIDSQMTSLRTLVASLKSNSSDHPYTDSASELRMSFPGGVSRPDSPEGETPDVLVRAEAEVPIRVAVASASAATVEVYVNGLAVSTNVVTAGQVAAVVPSRFLTAEKGRRNLVALISRNGQGARLHTTYALVDTLAAADFPVMACDLVVKVGSWWYDPEQPETVPEVTVMAPDGKVLVPGRDCTIEFVRPAEGRLQVVVTGLGNVLGEGLVEGQVNCVGSVTVPVVPERVVSSAELVHGLDTRTERPRRPATVDEVLPFAYDATWRQASSVESVTVTPVTNGVADSGRQVDLEVTNVVGTIEWRPTHRELYLAEIRLSGGGMTNVFLDLTGAKELAVYGSVAPNGDIVFTNLCDAATNEAMFTLPKSWLDETGVDPELARDTSLKGPNGLPVWQSYALGLDPKGEPAELPVAIEPDGKGGYRVSTEGLKKVRTDLVNVKYELRSTTDLGSEFGLYRSGQTESVFSDLPQDGARRFYRASVKIYWK